MFGLGQMNSNANANSRPPVFCLASLLLAPLVLAALCCGRVAAADVPTTRPATAANDRADISQWLSQLANTDPALREQARDRLLRLSRKDLPRLQQVLRQEPRLAPSQMIALRQIVQEVYLAGEPYDKETDAGVQHGFLGIMMDQDPGDVQQPNDNGQAPGIIVTYRFPGFCAARMLRNGDIIVASLNPDNTLDKVFNNVHDLQTVIGSADPGSPVRLLVLRQGQIIRVRVTLDCRPLDATPQGAEPFCRERLDKFDEYWRETFVPLLKDSLG